MRLVTLMFMSFLLHFAFSSQKEGKNPLKNNLKQSHPVQDLLEVMEEVENDDAKSVSKDEKISLQLKETNSVRQLAQIPEPASAQSPKNSKPELKVDEIGKRNAVKSDIKSLLHESVFQRENAKRSLDVYVEDSDLPSQSEEVQEDFGNVEVHWKPPEDLN